MKHYHNEDYMLQLSPEDKERFEQIFLALCIRESQEKSRGGSIPINYYRLSNEHLFPDMPQARPAGGNAYMNESFGLAAFRSRTQVLRMENALHRAGLSAGVIATPREIAVGCGLSVRFDLSDTPQVLQIYRRLNPSALIGFYRAEGYGTRRLTLTPLIEKR